MSPDNEELEIERLLAGRRLKRPPDALTSHYVAEVRGKIARQGAGAGWGMALGLCAALALAAGLAFILLAQRREVPAPARPPTVSQAAQAGSGLAPAHTAEPVSDELLQSLEDDLFLLEMLGEDEGLIDAPERIETDLEFSEQAGLVGGTS